MKIMDSEAIPVSFTQMEQDLYLALESDSRRKLENDAKIRAVSQRVSYDEFRDLVRAAHLKPVGSINPLSMTKNQKGRIWNNIVTYKKNHDSDSSSENRKPVASPSCNSPQLPISAQFLSSWQQSDPISRFSILCKMGPIALNDVFTIDMPTALLGEIFEALLCFNPVTDIVTVNKLMEALTKIKRFNLIVHFLNASEKASCQQLITKLKVSLVQQEQDLAEEGVTEWTIQELGKKFLVNI